MPHQSLRNLTLSSVVILPMFLTSSSDMKRFAKQEGVNDFASKVAKGL